MIYPSYLHSIVNLSESRDLRCNCRLETPNYNTIKYGKKKFEIYRSISVEWYMSTLWAAVLFIAVLYTATCIVYKSDICYTLCWLYSLNEWLNFVIY